MRKIRHGKEHFKIITALLLVILMAFSILPLSAFALDADQNNTEFAPNSEDQAGLKDRDYDTNKKSEDKSGDDASDSNTSTGKDENEPETPAENEKAEQKDVSEEKPETNLGESPDLDKKDGASKDREAWKKALEEELKKKTEEDFVVQPFSIIQPTQPTYTYIFKVGDTEFARQIVKNGEKLLEPKTPKEANKRFLGWQQKNSDGSLEPNYFDFSQPVTIAEDATSQEIELVANFEEVYYVYFMWPRQGEITDENKEKFEVIASREGKPNDEVETTGIISPDIIFPKLDGQEFAGWYEAEDLSGTAVGDTIKITDKDITLWPKFQPTGYWLHFFPGDDASTVASVFFKRGEETTKPEDPTRVGYSFKHWSKEDGGSDEFPFGTPLSEDTKLYAVWEPQEVNYTVVFWLQRASDNKNASDADKTYDFGKKEVRKAKTGEIVSPSVDDQEWEYLNFHYNATKSVKVTVEPDGSTSLDIYYDRNLFYIHLHFMDGTEKVITGLYGTALQVDTEEYDVAYNSDENIAPSYRQFMWTGDKELTLLEIRGYPLPFRFDGPMFKYGNVETTEHTNDTAHLYQNPEYPAAIVNLIDMERLNGEYPDIYDGFDADEKSLGVKGKYYPILDVYPGFTFEYYSKKHYPTEAEWERFAGEEVIDTTDLESKFFRIRAKRNSYNLIFWNYDKEEKTETVLYNALLEGYKGFIPPRPEHLPEYYDKFEGWYLDDQFEEGPCNFDTQRMPAGNLILFAKWGDGRNVESIAYLKKEGGDHKLLTKEYGAVIENASLPQIVKDDGTVVVPGDTNKQVILPKNAQWIGWTTKDAEGKYQLYSFGQAVYKRTELYPYYVEKGLYTVTYHYPGNDGSEKTKIDPKTYTKDSQADVLPWPTDGKVPEGKVFLAWTTAAAKSGYTSKDAIVVKKDVDFYPVFGPIPEKVQVTYDGNGGELSGAKTVKLDPVANNSLLKVKDNTETDGLGFERTVELSSGPRACVFRLWEYTRKGKIYRTNPGEEYILDIEDPATNVLKAIWAEPIEIKVTTVWEDQDNKAKKRPDALDVQLRRNGADLGDPLKLNADVEWQGLFGQEGDLLDIDDACNPYTYDIVAPDVAGYKKTVRGDVKNGFTISYILPVEPSPEGRKYVVIVDPNGGVWPDGSSENLRYLFDGGDIFTLPEPPSKEGHVFDYWQGPHYNPGDEYVVTEDHYFLAIWNPTEVPEIRVPIPVGGQMSTLSPSQPTPTQATPVPAQVVALPRTGESRLESYRLSASLGLLAGVLIFLRKKYKA